MVARLFSMAAIALLALAGCASESDGYYSRYPDEAYYGPYSYPYYAPYPYYGGYSIFGYNSGFDRDFDHDFDHRRHRFFRPSDHVTCDRRTRTCSDDHGFDKRLTERYFGSAATPRFHDDEDRAKPAERQPDTRMSRSFDQDQAPPSNRKRQTGPLPDDDDRGQPMLLPQRVRPQGMADNDDGDSGPAVRMQQNRPDRPGPAGGGLLRLQNNGNAGAGGCPPKGCSNK